MPHPDSVITCRKMDPKIHPSMWCRSCSLNLKKRCEGVQSSEQTDEELVRKRSRSDETDECIDSEHFSNYRFGPTTAINEEKWVQCEGCQMWRRLPDYIDLSDLPEKWYCHMNIWDDNANKCESGPARKEPRRFLPATVHEMARMDQFRMMTPATSIPVSTSVLSSPCKPSPQNNRDNSLAEVLGLKTVEKVKDLCRAYGIRTTRAGTNGGRKSKGELIDDLLEAGVTRIDDAYVQSLGKERRRRGAPAPVQVPKKEFSKSNNNSPLTEAATFVDFSPRTSSSSNALDNLAEVACLALLEHSAVTKSPDTSPPARFPGYDQQQLEAAPSWMQYRPFVPYNDHFQAQGQYGMPSYEEQPEMNMAWGGVPSGRPTGRNWAW